MATLVLLLGDQLTPSISSLRGADPADTVVLMAEVAEEAGYVRHHKKKIAFLFAAMRHHAQALTAAGWRVYYTRLDDPDNAGSLTGEVARAVRRHRVDRIAVTHPGEWRLLEAVRGWRERFGIPVEIRDDDRFLCTPEEFARWAEGRRQLRMEFFYREMRRKTGVLMQGEAPVGG